VKHALFSLGIFFFAPIAQAALPNVAWFYHGGYFVKDLNTGLWSETIGATETFNFREDASTATTVDLYDPTRGMTVRLTDGAIYLKAKGASSLTYFKSGRWDNRRVFTYNLGGGREGYYQLIAGAMYRHVTFDNGQKTSTYLRDNGRDGQTLNLLYPRNNTSYAIQGADVYIRTAAGKWVRLFSGRWS
jgi:hypothetical protein